MSLVVPFEEIFDSAGLLSKAAHWERAELGLSVSILNGFPLKSSAFNSESGFPVIRIRDLKFNKVQTYYSGEFPEEYIISDGDLLVGMDGDFNCYIWNGGKAVLNQRVCKLQPNESFLLKRFLFYGINGYLNAIQKATSSVTVGHLSSIDTGKIPFPLPPLPEQSRIVAKLDAVMQKVESNKLRLDEIPKLLKRFRQSVLAAAVSGRLTEEWREKDGIIDEWEEVELNSVIPKGGIFDGPFGSNLKTIDYTDKGIRVIRLENIEHLYFVFEKETYITEEKYQVLTRHTVGEGDIIFSSFISGEIRACILPKLPTKAIAKADCFCIRPNETAIDKIFLLYILISLRSYEQLVLNIHGATRPRINTTQLKTLLIPLPELKEQKEIVRRVEQLFAFADKIEARYNIAKTMLDKLPQSILAKAFRGELVPLDPNDEPASVLLERIKAESIKSVINKRTRIRS
jgi:type I restriction enzyme S subunit